MERLPAPTAFGSYAYGWQQFKRHFLYLFLIGLVVGIATFPIGIPRGATGPDGQAMIDPVWQILIAAYGFLIFPVVKYGASLLYVRYMRNDEADIRDIFDGFRKNYLNIVLANLMVAAIVVMGFILLIVPGVVFACRLSFVPYLVMDKGLDPVAAVEKSWNMTRGHGFRIFGMFLMGIPLVLLGFLLLAVGAFFSFILISCAFASLYCAIDHDEQQHLDANGSAATAGADAS